MRSRSIFAAGLAALLGLMLGPALSLAQEEREKSVIEKELAEGTGNLTKPDEGALNADVIARDLANPNTPLASLNLKFQVRTFDGSARHAEQQESLTVLLQPTLPFPLPNKDIILFRPAIPLLIEQPVPSGPAFDSKTGLGDISFDLAYATTTKSGLLLATGIISSLPTATSDDLGTEQWTLGPELLVGYLQKKYVMGIFPNHQWDVAGNGNRDVNLTTTQVFGVYLPSGGWSVGTTPIIAYDWESEDWTVPLNVTAGRTLVLNGRPWKFSAELNYYVERSDTFGPQWMIGFTVTPVVENVMASWFQ